MALAWFLGIGTKSSAIAKFFVLFFEEDAFCFNGADVCASIASMTRRHGILRHLFMVLFGR